MNAISLWQPWASAIAVGLKTIETRSWAPPTAAIGQPLAICSAKAQTVFMNNERLHLRDWWIAHVRYNPDHHIPFHRAGMDNWVDLPFGKVVATARLYAVCSTSEDPPPDGVSLNTDAAWGDFSPGRFAWFLDNITPLEQPVPVIGRQGIFNWSPTPHNL